MRGTVRVEEETFQLRSLTLEYMEGAEPFIAATISYADVRVPGGTVRLPVAASFAGRPIGQVGKSIGRVEGRVVFADYGELAPVAEEAREP